MSKNQQPSYSPLRIFMTNKKQQGLRHSQQQQTMKSRHSVGEAERFAQKDPSDDLSHLPIINSNEQISFDKENLRFPSEPSWLKARDVGGTAVASTSTTRNTSAAANQLHSNHQEEITQDYTDASSVLVDMRVHEMRKPMCYFVDKQEGMWQQQEAVRGGGAPEEHNETSASENQGLRMLDGDSTTVARRPFVDTSTGDAATGNGDLLQQKMAAAVNVTVGTDGANVTKQVIGNLRPEDADATTAESNRGVLMLEGIISTVPQPPHLSSIVTILVDAAYATGYGDFIHQQAVAAVNAGIIATSVATAARNTKSRVVERPTLPNSDKRPAPQSKKLYKRKATTAGFVVPNIARKACVMKQSPSPNNKRPAHPSMKLYKGRTTTSSAGQISTKKPRVAKRPEQLQYFFKTDKDVIFGRGSGPNLHNTFFRKQVVLRRREYFDGHNAEKAKVVNELFDWVHTNGGRFLEKEKKTSGDGQWFQVTRKAVLVKIRQMIRENKMVKERQRVGGVSQTR